MGKTRSDPKKAVRWVIWRGNYPWLMSFTRRDAIAEVLRQVGQKYTWKQMQSFGYVCIKTILSPQPVADESAKAQQLGEGE